MFDVLGKYQASLFVKSTEIVPSPDVISTLLKMFSDKELLPSTFQEIGPQSLTPQVRLRLNSQNNEWGINFATNRIDIEKNPVLPGGKNLGDLRDFVKDVKDFFSRILGQYKKKGNRLSLITAGMLCEMTEEQLSGIYTKLFRPLPFYEETMPFEWNQRCASKYEKQIGSEIEQLNVITNISRIKGQFVDLERVTQFDRIEVTFDINTAAENDENRFNIEMFDEFLFSAIDVRSRILEQIRGVVNG